MAPRKPQTFLNLLCLLFAQYAAEKSSEDWFSVCSGHEWCCSTEGFIACTELM